jgi:tRNA_anti-like
MKKQTYLLLFLFLLIIVSSAVLFFYNWEKPHQNVEHIAGIKIAATDLFREFTEHEKHATEKYNGKVLEVTGTVLATSTNMEAKTVVQLQTDDLLFGINCTMEQNTNIKQGSTVTLKGMCSGFTSDVILIRCYLINKTT